MPTPPPADQPTSLDVPPPGSKTTPATIENGAPEKGNGDAPIAKTADVATEKATPGRYTIAPGRNLIHGEDHTYGKNGELRALGKTRNYVSGDKIDLDEDEAKRLLALGFILDEDGSVIVRADGPAINVEDGIQIAQDRA